MLIPKCALCATAYASALGALGLSPAVHERVVEPLLVIAVGASLVTVCVVSFRRRDLATPLVALAGAVLVLTGRHVLAGAAAAVTIAGAVLLLGASLVNAARCRKAKAPHSAAARVG